MSDIYVMQRANGDVFALDDHGRFRVPLFHSSRDAMIARSRNWEMLLFKPVPLDTSLLTELFPLGGESEVDLWLVKDPSVSLKHGCLVEHAQLPLMGPIEPQIVSGNGDSPDRSHLRTLPQTDSVATETWEDEGGNYSKRLGSLEEALEGRRIHDEKASCTSDRLVMEIPGFNP